MNKDWIRPVEVNDVYGGDVVRALLFSSEQESAHHVIRVAVAVAQPGKGGQLHYHPDSDEVYFVLEGQGALELAGQRIALCENTCVNIPRGTRHRLECISDVPLRYIAFHIADINFGAAVRHVPGN